MSKRVNNRRGPKGRRRFGPWSQGIDGRPDRKAQTARIKRSEARQRAASKAAKERQQQA